MKRFVFLSFALFVAATPIQARAGTFNIADGDVTSLKTVIAASNANDEDDVINLAQNGTYDLTTVEDTTYGPAGLPLISADRGHTLTINGNAATIVRSSNNTPHFRVVNVDVGTNVIFNNLILAGGNSDEYVTADGTYEFGGGAIHNNGTLVLNSCAVTGNSAHPNGGGIYNYGTLTLNGSVVSNNTAANDSIDTEGEGGGIDNSGSAIIYESSIVNNIAEGAGAAEGGGIANEGSITITASTIGNNTASASMSFGGGLWVFTGTAELINTTIASNNASSRGGGIEIASGSTVPPAVTLISCTVANNVGNSGVNQDQGSLTVGNTIFADGLATFGGSFTSQGYNLSRDNGSGALTGPGDKINTDPLLDPAGLQNNGGPTATIALTFGSPAIDQGKSFNLPTDQRGASRTVDSPAIPNASGGDGTDIGAYEAPTDALQNYAATNAFSVTTLDDHDDGICSQGDCSLREAINRACATGLKNVSMSSLSGTATLQSALNLTGRGVNLYGPGARSLTLSGGGVTRIFLATSGASVISFLTINDGNLVDSNNHGETRQGGAVFNQRDLTFQSCAFIGNSVMGAANVNNGGSGGAGQGGAIFNTGIGSLSLIDCTFVANSAKGSAGTNYTSQNGLFAAGGMGGDGDGGAIFNDTNASLTISNCTFASNGATGGAAGTGSVGPAPAGGGNAKGAAVFNQGTLQILSATISGNTGSGGNGAKSGPFNQGPRGSGSGGVSAGGAQSTVTNTIIAANSGNTAPDAEGTFISTGYNLIGIADQSSGFRSSNHDQLGSTAIPLNPHLAQLQNNGGATNTMALLYGSTAHDAGFDANSGVDQRGFARSDIFGTDIGAVQMNLLGGPDSDGDGMSDDFERFYGLNPNDSSDANIDSDGDGMTNLQEFQAGTNPRDPNSRLAITSIAKSGNTVTILFGLGVTSKTYRLERTNSLQSPVTWMPVSDQTIDGASGTFTFTDPNAGSTPYFYHVILEP